MKKNQRTTVDLIDELIEESKYFYFLAIAVGFDRKTRFIEYDSKREPYELLTELDWFVEQGGEPIGLIGFTKMGKEGKLTSKPFTEYADEDWARDYLHTLTIQVAEEGIINGIFRDVK